MKKIQIFVILAGVLFLAGCGCAKQKAQNNQTIPEDNQSAKNQAPAENQNPDGFISSIKDAMGSGKKMKCTYVIKAGDKDLTTTSYVDGKKFMSTTTIAGSVNHVLFDETATYIWTEGQKQGTKMTMACAEDLTKNAPQTSNDTPAPDPTGEKTFDSATNVSCEPASGADFSVPTDVTFSDQCETLKNVMKNIPSGAKVPANLPSGVPQL